MICVPRKLPQQLMTKMFSTPMGRVALLCTQSNLNTCPNPSIARYAVTNHQKRLCPGEALYKIELPPKKETSANYLPRGKDALQCLVTSILSEVTSSSNYANWRNTVTATCPPWNIHDSGHRLCYTATHSQRDYISSRQLQLISAQIITDCLSTFRS